MREYFDSMMLMSLLMGILLIVVWLTGGVTDLSMTFMQGVWTTLAWVFCLGVIPTLVKDVTGVILGAGFFLYITHYFIM